MKKLYINRELSWLKFNARVLQEAADKKVPLLERLRFLGIFSNNLDEFFKIRYATVKRMVHAKEVDSVLGAVPKKLLEQITQEVIDLQTESLSALEEIQSQLQKEGIFIINETELLPEHISFVKQYFIKKVSSALFVILLDEIHTFPKLKDDNAYLVVKMSFKENQEILKENATHKTKVRYALIELSSTLERFIVLPSIDSRTYIILIDDLIRYCLGNIFSLFNYEKISAHMIKITRDAELDIDDDLSKSFISKLSSSVEGRRSGEPVRLIYDKTIDSDTLDFLLEKLNIEQTDSIIPGGRYHNRRDYMNFPSLSRTDLLYASMPALALNGLSLEGRLLKKIAVKDYLLYAPYHDFSYIIRFLREAALDPKVKTIKITLYRLAKNSQVVNSLINAVKNGKKVVVQIELQARFDEQANIAYAEQMQQEGIKLIFGVKGLKVHSKIAVIEREENDQIKRYGFISTGNFNETNARVYTDYTLLTANTSILKEVDKIFDFLEMPYKNHRYKHLIVSPHGSKKSFIQLIDNEINWAKQGVKSFIMLKMNSLTNHKMINKLYEASCAGVSIRMIIRGVCCLIPGVKGMSENIEVISIVDRFLEHPRLFIFSNGGAPKYYISSSDWMTRNLEHRVEVTSPIYDENIQRQLWDTFEIGWNDTVKARVISQNQDNHYRKGNPEKQVRSQYAVYEYFSDMLKEK